jgi:hypothetical protein
MAMGFAARLLTALVIGPESTPFRRGMAAAMSGAPEEQAGADIQDRKEGERIIGLIAPAL